MEKAQWQTTLQQGYYAQFKKKKKKKEKQTKDPSNYSFV